ncbi:hypothetical protein L873DRAFT_1804457 [Choiromyces venosus 120613-1]|uniref:Uncharacterized protein n=1 Tax=Choiromyces venosus 120613-1 TaxID=1336337 RepID=A0A3N4JQZ1_9PEZI|nr:hypothetical protein L873DRAFT_1812725 [Choiromyces venosus 120613-1]RPB00744.1 hypothetical protein L873DRAFT_1804457 [Choiromyces venosus 120613-1]
MDSSHSTDVPTNIIDEVSELASNLSQYDNLDCHMTSGNTWGDRRTYSLLSTSPSSHNTLSWTACHDEECIVHKGDKEA